MAYFSYIISWDDFAILYNDMIRPDKGSIGVNDLKRGDQNKFAPDKLRLKRYLLVYRIRFRN